MLDKNILVGIKTLDITKIILEIFNNKTKDIILNNEIKNKFFEKRSNVLLSDIYNLLKLNKIKKNYSK